MESSIKAVHDRTLAATVTHIAICPSMHLLAVTLDANAIAIFRSSSMARLATISINTSTSEERITTVAWSPSGAHLIVATTSRRISIYSLDRVISMNPSARARRAAKDTESIASIDLPASATAIVWVPSVVSPDSQARHQDRASVLLPIICPAKSNDSTPLVINENGLIYIGDSSGYLTVLTADLSFTVVRFYVLSSSSDAAFVSDIHLTKNNRKCIIIGKFPNHNENNKNNRLTVNVVNTSSIYKFRHEIDRLTREVVAWKSFLRKATTEIETIEYSMNQIINDILIESIMKPMKEVMKQYAEDEGQVWTQLQEIFCGSRIKTSILHFLTNNLGENGAKELLRSFEILNVDMHKSFSKLLPLTENSLFRISQLTSLTDDIMSSKYPSLGISSRQIHSLFQLFDSFYKSLFLLSESSIEKSSEPACFLIWICLIAKLANADSESSNAAQLDLQMSTHETKNILKFFERVTRRFFVHSLVEEDQNHSNEWNMELEQDLKIRKMKKEEHENEIAQNAENRDGDDEKVVQVMYGIHIKKDLVHLDKCFTELMTKPCDMISAKLETTAELSLTTDNGGKCNMYDWDEEKSTLVVLASDSGTSSKNGTVTVIKYDRSGKVRAPWRICELSVEQCSIYDAVVLTHNSLGTKLSMMLDESKEDESYGLGTVGIDTVNNLLDETSSHLCNRSSEDSRKFEIEDCSNIPLKKVSRPSSRIVLPQNHKQKTTTSFQLRGNEQTSMITLLAAPRRIVIFESE